MMKLSIAGLRQNNAQIRKEYTIIKYRYINGIIFIYPGNCYGSGNGKHDYYQR